MTVDVKEYIDMESETIPAIQCRAVVTCRQYIDMESETIPYETQWGQSISEIEISCPNCNNLTKNNKYRFNEYENSLDIVSMGLCNGCGLVVTAVPLRFYRDGRIVWKNDEGEWVQFKEAFISGIMRKIKSLFRK